MIASQSRSSFTEDACSHMITFINSIINYYGIRYAAPPVGELRWRTPMDIESHGGYNPSEILDATARGPICVQGVPYWRQTIKPHGSEDCLLLDVLVPKIPASDYLPVLVQIHGGGYDQGNSSNSPGYMMVNQSMGNLIYVSIQYRLASFGFLGSAEIRNRCSQRRTIRPAISPRMGATKHSSFWRRSIAGNDHWRLGRRW